MESFLVAWLNTGREEGGYVNNPADKGGPTNHGITERVARANGFEGDMRHLPREKARAIAKLQYWDLMRLDSVAALSVPIALEMFDTGINAGQATVVKFLQRCLNVGNRRASIYPDMLVDGLIGPMTISNLRLFLKDRGSKGELVLLRALNCLQGVHYVEISEKREANEDFLFGWLLNRVQL